MPLSPLSFVTLALSALSGCSVLLATDDLVSSTAPRASDAGSFDGAPDSSARPVDSGLDAAPATDAAPETWCARMRPGVKYCADFDDGRPIAANGVASTRATIVPGLGIDQSNAVRVAVPQTTTYEVATVVTPLVGGGAVAEFELAVRLETAGSSNYAEVSNLRLRAGALDYEFFVSLNNGITFSDRLGTAADRVVKQVPADLTRSRSVRVRIETATARWHVTADVDDVRVIDEDLQQFPPQPADTAQLTYGINYSGASTAKSVIIDNVVLHAHP